MTQKKLPTVDVDEATGHYFVRVAKDCRLLFWMERHHGEDHHFVRLDVPDGTPVIDHWNGYAVIRPTRN